MLLLLDQAFRGLLLPPVVEIVEEQEQEQEAWSGVWERVGRR